MFWSTTAEKSVPPNLNYRVHLRGKSLGSFSWCGIYLLFSHAEPVYYQSKSLVAECCMLYWGTSNAWRSSTSKAILSAVIPLLSFSTCSRDFRKAACFPLPWHSSGLENVSPCLPTMVYNTFYLSLSSFQDRTKPFLSMCLWQSGTESLPLSSVVWGCVSFYKCN